MSKVTSKLQITIPKALAERYRIRPGDDVEWSPAGDSLRLSSGNGPHRRFSVEDRLRLFDQATERLEAAGSTAAPTDRGWTREDLYRRGGAD